MTRHLNDEPHTNSIIDHRTGLAAEDDRIRSSINSAPAKCDIATEIAIESPQSTLHTYVQPSDSVVDGFIFKPQTKIASESGTHQEIIGSAFKRVCRADVFPTPPFTPATKKTDESTPAVAESLPWLKPLRNGLSNLAIDSSSSVGSVDMPHDQDDSYFFPRLPSSPVSSSRVEGLPTPEEESQEYKPPVGGKINSRSSSLLDSHPDSFTTSSNPPIRPYVQSDSGTDSCPSSPSPLNVNTSSTTTSAMPSFATVKISNYTEKAKRRISSYEIFVPPPPGTFTSARAQTLRSEVQGRLVRHAQRKAARETEVALRNKYYPEVPTILPRTEEAQSTNSIPVSVEPPSHTEAPIKKKSRDTSKWSYSRQTSLFWHDAKRESFYPYATLGIAELDCFGAGVLVQTTDTYTSSMEERYPELKWKAQVESDRKKKMLVADDRKQGDSVDNGLETMAGKKHMGIQTVEEAKAAVERL